MTYAERKAELAERVDGNVRCTLASVASVVREVIDECSAEVEAGFCSHGVSCGHNAPLIRAIARIRALATQPATPGTGGERLYTQAEIDAAMKRGRELRETLVATPATPETPESRRHEPAVYSVGRARVFSPGIRQGQRPLLLHPRLSRRRPPHEPQDTVTRHNRPGDACNR